MRPGPEQRLERGRPPGPPFLRTAQLNVVGYAALVGACLVAAVVTALVLRATGWALLLRAAVGPLLVVVALLVADRRKWARMETGHSFTDDPAELRAVADRLRAQGLAVRVETEWGPALTYRNRDAKRVRAALRASGIEAI